LIPLNDSTEARYAEIARLMLSNHDWVRLMHYPGQFFWAKPPLSTWLSAGSMGIFGVSAFAARLPAWILSIFCLFLTGRMAYAKGGIKAGIWACGILATTLYFLLDAGTVMTDPALLTCVTMVMLGFWLGLETKSRFWAYFTFVGWGFGLLAKGLVMGVFSVLPIIVWLTWTKKWSQAWTILPWIKGSILTLAIALPWYLLAERRMPGFLSYFVVGEHFMRFLKPGWTGDLYGFAHKAPLGMIWVYFLLGTLPWSFWLLKNLKSLKQALHQDDIRYLVCFAILPLLFFTFARNIIYPYVFPVLPAFALLVTYLIQQLEIPERSLEKGFYWIAGGLTLMILVASWGFNHFPKTFSKSTNEMVAVWKKKQTHSSEHLIYALTLPEYSSMFYSRGQVLATRDVLTLCRWLQQGPQYLVLDSAEPSVFQAEVGAEFKAVYATTHRQRVDSLYHIDHLPQFCQKLELAKA
jgi:4-amino-4-deoxy-L-arabinose transferase-like glycosyltransferase